MDFNTVLDQVLALLRQRGRSRTERSSASFSLTTRPSPISPPNSSMPTIQWVRRRAGAAVAGDVSTAPEASLPILQPETSRSIQDTPATRSASLPISSASP